MQCEFCLGAGYVGGDNEPAECDHEPKPNPPAWDHPANKVPGCPRCFGTGEVIGLGGGAEQPAKVMIKVPCPECNTRPDRQDSEHQPPGSN